MKLKKINLSFNEIDEVLINEHSFISDNSISNDEEEDINKNLYEKLNKTDSKKEEKNEEKIKIDQFLKDTLNNGKNPL